MNTTMRERALAAAEARAAGLPPPIYSPARSATPSPQRLDYDATDEDKPAAAVRSPTPSPQRPDDDATDEDEPAAAARSKSPVRKAVVVDLLDSPALPPPARATSAAAASSSAEVVDLLASPVVKRENTKRERKQQRPAFDLDDDDDVVELVRERKRPAPAPPRPAILCSKCGTTPPNPGFEWCQGCFLTFCRERDEQNARDARLAAQIARNMGAGGGAAPRFRGGFGGGFAAMAAAGMGHGGGGYRGHGGGGGYVQQPGAPPENASYEELMAWEASRGSVSTGMSKQRLGRLPERAYLGQGVDALKGEEASCSVCMSEYEQGEKITVLPCFHSFHSECVNRWLESKPTCPVCMRDVRQDV